MTSPVSLRESGGGQQLGPEPGLQRLKQLNLVAILVLVSLFLSFIGSTFYASSYSFSKPLQLFAQLKQSSSNSTKEATAHTYGVAKLPSSECLQWFHEYAAFHAQHRGNASTKYLVHLVDGAAGGLGDRLNGAIAMLRLAYALKRVLLIKWQTPYELEEFLQPAAVINWSTRGLPLGKGSIFRFIDEAAWKDPKLHDGSLDLIQDKYLTLITNLPLNGTCWHCPNVPSAWSREAACLWQQMFEPVSSIVHKAQAEMSKLYAGQPRPFVAVHLRLGGLTGEEGLPGHERGKSPLHNFLAGARCAAKLASNISIQLMQTPALVITDSHDLRQVLRQRPFANFVSPGGLPVHLDRAHGETLESHLSTIVDMVMLGWSQCLVTSRSGFSLHAWLYGGAKSCVSPYKECL